MLKTLELRNFRNFGDSTFEFDNNKTLIIGPNGEGKTNILESIGLFSDNNILEINYRDLVKKGEIFFYVKVIMENKNEFSVSYDKENNKKKYFINNKSTSKKNLVNTFSKTVSFHPMIMNMMYLSPSLRRDFLDSILASSYPEYGKELREYKKILINRNRTLKNINEGKSQKSEVFFWNQAFIKKACLIYSYREKVLKYIEENIYLLKEYLNNKVKEVSFIYKTKINREEVENSIKQYIEKNLDRDIILQKTYIGPHLDDFELDLDGVPLINFASRGEVKSLILGLKFIEAKFINYITDNNPIFIVDDILSELDGKHINTLLKNFGNNQAVITSIKDINLEGKKIYL